MPIDSVQHIETPEGVQLSITPAGLWPRAWALALDILVRMVLYAFIFSVLGYLGRLGQGLVLILLFLIEWFYPVVFEMLWAGQTPGKRAMGIYVAHHDARPVTFASSIIRNLLRGVDFLPLGYFLGLISMITSKQHQRLGDLAADTLVLYQPNIRKLPDFAEFTAKPPKRELSHDEQQAILLFAERYEAFSPERQEELARHTGNLLAESDSGKEQLLGIASWLNQGAGASEKSFVKNHEQDWQQFEALLDAVGDNEEKRLSFPHFYRLICHHLALAQSRGFSNALITRLNQLAVRGHQQFYSKKLKIWAPLAKYLGREFPQVIRSQKKVMVMAALAFFGSALIVAALVVTKPDLVYFVVPYNTVANVESMYEPTAHHRLGRERESDTDLYMFGHYIRNNTSIGFYAFAGGLLFGLGTLFFMVYNGLFFGAIAAHLTNIGSGVPFWSFVSGHSAFELTAIVVSGAAGFVLARSLISPGLRTRRLALVEDSRVAIRMVYGAAVLFILAAFIEAFWSAQVNIPSTIKYAVGILLWFLTWAYLLLVGRRHG